MQFNEALARHKAANEAKVRRATRFFLSQHFDANETAFLERDLTQKRSLIQQVLFEDLQAQTFLPMANDIAPHAETYSWKVLTQTGKARVGARGNKDIPRVDVSGDERTGKTVKIDAAYGWEIEELAEAARIGFPLMDKKLNAARRAIALGIDDVLALGQPLGESGLPFTGFINNADVIALGILNPAGDPWIEGTTTPAQMLQSLNSMVSAVINAVGNIQQLYPDTILMPTPEFILASQVHVDSTNDVSVLRSFLNNNPFIKNIAPWQKLVGNGAGGTNRAIIYKRDPLVLEGVAPLDFLSLAPQAQGFEMVVPCMGRAGGTKIYHPPAVRYADFTAA